MEIAGDGSVVIVPEPGHTPDSIVIFVSLPSGVRYAFVGDLAWQMEGLDIPDQGCNPRISLHTRRPCAQRFSL